MEPLGIPFVDWMLNLMDTWGYLVTFLGSVLENIAFLGAMTPGDVIVVTAAFVASKGHLSIIAIGLLSTLGTIVGNNITFFFFRRRGRGAFLSFARRAEKTRVGRWIGISDESLLGAERYFDIHGAKTIFMARFATGVKGYVIAIAGTCRMSIFWFELYTVISAVTYAAIMCVVGWLVGANIDKALSIVSGLGYVGLVVFVLFVTVVMFGGRFALHRRSSAKIEDLGEEVEAELEAAEEPVLAGETEVYGEDRPPGSCSL